MKDSQDNNTQHDNTQHNLDRQSALQPISTKYWDVTVLIEETPGLPGLYSNSKLPEGQGNLEREGSPEIRLTEQLRGLQSIEQAGAEDTDKAMIRQRVRSQSIEQTEAEGNRQAGSCEENSVEGALASAVPDKTQNPAVQQAEQAIEEAAAVLAAGGTVAFPTETVYGLGADARSTQAVEKIFAAKGRPSDNPLIVHIADVSQLDELVTEVSPAARRLMAAFWPGPLTLVLPVRPGAVSPRVTAGLSTVAVRMPAHDIALRLIAAAGCPVAAPSANRSGRPSPTLASHVGEDLAGAIDGIVDGGPTGVGLESTVVECGASGEVTVLRPGGITSEQLASVAASVKLDPALQSGGEAKVPAQPRSPGMKYTHYAPKGRLCVVKGPARKVAERIQSELDAAAARGERTGVLAFDEHLGQYSADAVLSLGSLAAPGEAAQRLYAALRRLDEEHIGFILSEACSEEGLGAAVMNRLLKAAGQEVINV